MAALLRDELHIVVTEYGNGIWEWEICRRGEPLSVRMRDGPFGSEEVALAAGKIALCEFLELLARIGCLVELAAGPTSRSLTPTRR